MVRSYADVVMSDVTTDNTGAQPKVENVENGKEGPEAPNQFEREQKFFGFPPAQFVDDVYTVVDDYSCDAFDYLEKHMGNALQGRVNAAQIEEKTNRLLETMRKACDKNFDKFEIYLLRNILRVPEEVDVEALCKNAESKEIKKSETTPAEFGNVDNDIEAVESAIEKKIRRNAELKWSNQSCQEALGKLEDQLKTLKQMSALVDQQKVETMVKMNPQVQYNSEKCSDLIQILLGQQRKSEVGNNPLTTRGGITSCERRLEQFCQGIGNPSADFLAQINAI